MASARPFRLSGDGTVTVQLQNSAGGACFSAEYDSAYYNFPTRYRAKSNAPF